MNVKLRKGAFGSFKAKAAAVATALALSGAAALVPLAAVADHTTAHTIDQLTAQILQLQAQLGALSGGSPPSGVTSSAGKCFFTRDLTIGVRGDDVTCLQNYLTGTGHFSYSGGATGYFGSITRNAVSAWQASNGVTPTAGYFGPKSKAKYDSMVVILPPPTPTPVPVPTPPTPPGTPPPPAPAGSGLTVSAAVDQPAADLVPALAARVPFTKVVFTASADGDVTVKSLTIERQGIADDSAIDSVLLLDQDATQIGLSRTLNSNHQAVLNEAFVVKAGTSKVMTLAVNRPSAGSNAGQVAKIALVAVDAGTSAVNGALPIVGNGMTINESLTIGSLTSPTRGTSDPGAARGSLEVSASKFFATGVRWTVGAAEGVLLEQVRWYQAGSAATGDLTNVMTTVGGKDYPTTVSSDGKFYTTVFNPPIEYGKGDPIDLAIKTDIVSGSNRTINFDLQRRTDMVVRGKVFKYVIIPANGTSAAAADSGAFSSSEPYYDGFAHTISKGSLRVEKSNAVQAGNVAVGQSATELGAFNLDAKGEPITISSFKLTFTLSGSNQGTQIDNVALYDENGAVVAGPKDVGSDEIVTLSDTWTVPVGLHTYKVKGKLTTDFTEGSTLTASTTASSDITAKGQVTGLSITPSPAGVAANQMTVRVAALNVSIGATPTSQNVVRGVNGFKMASIQYDANTGEDVRVSAQKLTITTSGSADADDLNSCQLFDGATALNTGSNVVSPSGNAAGADKAETFTLDTNLIIPKGTVKVVDLKCNISANATAAETYNLGIAANTDTPTAVGANTGTSITPTVTINTGPTMTVRAGGVVRVSLDTSSPSEKLGLAGKTDQTAAVFRLEADFEDIDISKFAFTLASTTASTSDITKVTFWDGATKVGEGVLTGNTYNATSTFGAPYGKFVVPSGGSKLLTAKVDLINAVALGKTAATGADSGHQIRVNFDASRTTTIEGTGASSGTTINGTAGTDTNSRGIRIVKTYPTINRLSVPSNTLANDEMSLYRFSVAAPPEGSVGIYKFQFRISSTTVATTSAFKLYAYTNSAFSENAYAKNPINQNDVDCVGSTSLEVGANDTCSSNADEKGATNGGMSLWNWGYASSSIAIFPDPTDGTPTAPGREAISIPAGLTYYFDLKGTVAKTTVGDTISVALLGDNVFINAGSIGAGNEAALTAQAGNNIPTDTLAPADVIASSTANHFVWSPNTTSTSATTTNDWLTGFLVPGLPATEVSAQTFSK